MQERYASHVSLPGMGEAGQERLSRARALVVGAGGLGSVALYCLAGAGVGVIGIADGDTVSLGNLNRQFLHGTDTLGMPKVVSAVESLRRLNPEPEYRLFGEMLTDSSAENAVRGYDVVLAAVDSLSARLILNRACAKAGVPLVNGGVNGMDGVVQVVRYQKTACLACLYGDGAASPNKPVSYPPVVSVISSLMAQCALSLLLTGESPLGSELLYYDARTLAFSRVPALRSETCPVCSGRTQA